ncbi:MAG TPA: DUF1800 domain-containing protein, partial [Chitinophagaceae bacterium]|nr:DUF1800 domain-containing protein [Chitinophagaceae bacterium]
MNEALSNSVSHKLADHAANARTNTGLRKYNGIWSNNEVQHLLKRTLFGSTKKDIDQFTAAGMSATLDAILNYSSVLPAPPLNDYNSATINDPTVPAGSTWVNSPTNDGTINSVRRNSFKKWWTGVMISQESNIREKMTLFWANLFGTETNDIGNAVWVYNHHTLLRDNAVGNFRQLIKAVTIDPGMLRYLNGYVNTSSAPDENYARELQELFTLGKGSAVQYTEEDVRTAARVLTGWRINSNFVSYFDPTRHDTKPKTFSSFYGGSTINGKTGAAGADETDELIDMIFQKDEVSKYICRRLYRWFVYYKIDGAAEQNVIEPLAKIFRDSNYEIKPVLRALFESEHFYDVLNQGCFIKSPVDYVVSCLREFGVVFPSAYTNAYIMWNYIRNWCSSMTQDIGDPPNVSGWPAYYQEPQFHEIWINSDTLPKRNRFTDTMITSGYTNSGQKIVIDAIAFAKKLSNPGD